MNLPLEDFLHDTLLFIGQVDYFEESRLELDFSYKELIESTSPSYLINPSSYNKYQIKKEENSEKGEEKECSICLESLPNNFYYTHPASESCEYVMNDSVNSVSKTHPASWLPASPDFLSLDRCPYQAIELKDCKHCFHLGCLETWIQKTPEIKTCPVCRHPLSFLSTI